MLFPPQSNVLETEVRTAERVAKLTFDRNLAQVERPRDIRAWLARHALQARVQEGVAMALRDVPIGTGETGTRVESDSMGEVKVPADHYWGAQTQRSLIHFSIGNDRMPKAVYHAYGYVKKAAALVNAGRGSTAGVRRRRPSARSPTRSSPESSTASSRSTCGRRDRERSRT